MNVKVLTIYLEFCKYRGFEPNFKGLKRFNRIIKEVKK